MSTTDVVSVIDAEIARLQQARVILVGKTAVQTNGSVAPSEVPPTLNGKPKSNHSPSPEAREKIAASQRKRWEKIRRERKKAANASVKTAPVKAKKALPAKKTTAKKATSAKSAKAAETVQA